MDVEAISVPLDLVYSVRRDRDLRRQRREAGFHPRGHWVAEERCLPGGDGLRTTPCLSAQRLQEPDP
jgi:hypothetical protein